VERGGWGWSGPRGVEMLNTGPLGGSPTHPHHLIHIQEEVFCAKFLRECCYEYVFKQFKKVMEVERKGE